MKAFQIIRDLYHYKNSFALSIRIPENWLLICSINLLFLWISFYLDIWNALHSGGGQPRENGFKRMWIMTCANWNSIKNRMTPSDWGMCLLRSNPTLNKHSRQVRIWTNKPVLLKWEEVTLKIRSTMSFWLAAFERKMKKWKTPGQSLSNMRHIGQAILRLTEQLHQASSMCSASLLRASIT